MIKSAKDILKERGINLEKQRFIKMKQLDKNTLVLIEAITEWLSKQPVGTELLLKRADNIKEKCGYRFYDEEVKNDDGSVKVWHHLDYSKETFFMPDSRLKALGFIVYDPMDSDMSKYMQPDPYIYVSLLKD